MFHAGLDTQTTLRTLQPADADELFRLTDANRPHLRRWLPWVDGVLTVADTTAFIEAVQRQQAADLGFSAGVWSHGRLAGVIGYHDHSRAHRHTSLGYWLGADFEGHGLMTRATRALVDHALVELAFNRVEIRCAPANARSRAIPERLGFTLEGTIRDAEWLYDRFVDHAIYGMLARDWHERT